MTTTSDRIEISFTVPVVCKITNDIPDCNLEMIQIDPKTWLDKSGIYEIKLQDGILLIESI